MPALGGQEGHTLPELITSMAILMTVMAALAGLMVSGTTAEVRMNEEFQAHTQARLGLDRFRREVHCASSAATSAGPPVRATLTMPTSCATAGGNTNISWCTVASGSTYELWRYPGSACSGTGTKVAEHLTNANAFAYTTTAGSLAKLQITLAINPTPSRPERAYTLEDAIVLRNSTRS